MKIKHWKALHARLARVQAAMEADAEARGDRWLVGLEGQIRWNIQTAMQGIDIEIAKIERERKR